jgi:peptidoglycan-binding protein ArfA
VAGSEYTASTTQWRPAARFYRRPPGFGWLLGLLLIPLIIAAIGWHTLPRKELSAPNVTVPSASVSVPSVSMNAPTIPALSFAPLSIVRNGNDFTLSGDLPDGTVKAGLLDTLKGAVGGGATLIDNLNLKAGEKLPDLSGLGAVLKAAADVPDFSFKLDGDTITLTGTAPSEDVKAAIAAAAKTAWPTARINNEIQVKAATGGACGNLQADIVAALNAPITFETDGYTLTSGTQQMLAAVAAKIKGCPDAKITVTGYTDNTGNDAINIPLSNSRAKSVGDYLVSQSVPAGAITTRGLGAASPIAGNDTDAGRAQNRRVEITVS